MKRGYDPNINPKWNPGDEIEFREGIIRRWQVAARYWEQRQWLYTLVGLPDGESQPTAVLPRMSQESIQVLIAHKSGIKFTGETMTCSLCGKSQTSNPEVNSDWRAIEVDGETYYFCTDHFPPDATATKDDYARAYKACLEWVVEYRQSKRARKSLTDRRQSRRERKANHG